MEQRLKADIVDRLANRLVDAGLAQPLVARSEGDIVIEAVAEQLVIRVLKQQADFEPGLLQMFTRQGLALVEPFTLLRLQQADQLF